MISGISIDRFGEIDTLDLRIKELHYVNKSSGGDSLLSMLLAMKQSCVPGYLHDWQADLRSCESGFGGGRLEVRGRLFDGGTFARCLHPGSSYCSCRVEFVLENPESPVCEMTDASGPSDKVFTDKKRAGANDFRELTRLYGEKFGAVKRFVVGVENAFAPGKDDNILSYQMVSVRCERIWEADITSFFELVLYKNGTNYELFWDELPDIRGVRQSGRAKGCNVRMRNLQITNIVTDGVQDGARFEEILPSIVVLSRIAAWQFGTVKVLDFGEEISDMPCLPVFEPCRFVGMHGEYLDAVIRTYIDEKSRISWPDPVTGEVRRGLFEEAFETWRVELEKKRSEDNESCQSDVGSINRDMNAFSVLVQGLVLRTGETLVIRGIAGSEPEEFLAGLLRIGRQVIVV